MNKQIETTMATKATYKRLGDYIRLVDIRNQDLKVETLLGLSVEKRFFPSIANTIGTDMSTYKIIESGQFVYIADTSRRGDKIAIALYDKNELAIVSQAYSVFEITDEEQLCPDYLMMWFRRPEFDRYARFKSHGSAREIFDWETMCDVMLPIPSVQEQRKIVDEYQALVKRIEINNQLIAKLEDTAQAIYRNMFVDGIDKENLPEGWKMGTLGDVAKILDKERIPLSQEERLGKKGSYPYYGAMSIIDYIDEYIFDGVYLLFAEDGYVTDKNGHPNLQYVFGKFWLNNHAHILKGANTISTEFLYMALKQENVTHLVTGAAQPKINQESMKSISVIKPCNDLLSKFDERVIPLFNIIRIKIKENVRLIELQSLLLAKMGQ